MPTQKIKLNQGLASIIILASIFAGWQTLLLVTLLMFTFCEVDENTKNIAVKVITFYVGLTIVRVGWGLIADSFDIILEGIGVVVAIINKFLDPVDMIILSDYTGIIVEGFNLISGIVYLLIRIAEIAFVIMVLTGKPGKENFITKKINEYVNNALNFVSKSTEQQPVQPVHQAPPVEPTPPMPNPNNQQM